MKNTANIGDLVIVNGYNGRIFQVESYTYQKTYFTEYIDEYYTYDVVDIATEEYTVAFDEDLYVICRAKNVEQFIRDNPQLGMVTVQAESQPTPTFPSGESKVKTRSDKRKIDELLDELNDYRALVEMFGEHEDDKKRDRKYVLRMCEIIAQLKELTSKKE